MAVYSSMALTQAGLALYAKAQSGTTLTFTRMQIGGGQLTGGQTPATMTALNTPIAYFSINTISTSGSTSLVTGIYTNTGLASSTYTCEIGIFANDPTAGEILYAYANAGTQGDTIPPASAGPLSKQFQISIAVGNATSVTANTPAQNYIPTSQIGAANGVAPLNGSSVVPSANLPIATTSTIGAVKAGTNISVAGDGTLSVPSYPFGSLSGKPTTISGYGITDNIISSLTAGNNIAVTNPTGEGAATVSITGVIPVANGGTGSSTQNFVDLSTNQTIGGNKTFSSDATFSTAAWVGSSSTSFLELTTDASFNYIESWNGAKTGSVPLKLGGRYNGAVAVYTPNNTLDDGSGNATIAANLTAGNGQTKIIANTINSVGNIELALNFNNNTQYTHVYGTGLTVDGTLTVNGSGGSFANSKAANGYQKLPGGLIIQWGSVTVNGSSILAITFPTTFPTAATSIGICGNGSNNVYLAQNTLSTSGCTIDNNGSTELVYWMAIGY